MEHKLVTCQANVPTGLAWCTVFAGPTQVCMVCLALTIPLLLLSTGCKQSTSLNPSPELYAEVYFPLEVGRTWTYVLREDQPHWEELLRVYPEFSELYPERFTTRISGTKRVGIRDYFVFNDMIGPFDRIFEREVLLRREGPRIYQHRTKEDALLYDFTQLDMGSRWIQEIYLDRWDSYVTYYLELLSVENKGVELWVFAGPREERYSETMHPGMGRIQFVIHSDLIGPIVWNLKEYHK